MSPLSLPVLPHLLSSNTWTSIALWSLGVLSTILAVGYIYLEFYQDFQISYKNVPGPPRDSFFWGNFKTILDAPPSVPEKEWVEQYGHTIRFKFMLNSSRLFTTDTTALSYILNHSDVFQKPTSLRRALVELLGNGLLVSEGHEHKRQRKILQSAFNPANIRGMIPIFYDKAYELKDKMVALIEDSEAQCSPTPIRVGDEVKGGKQMDVMKYLGQATLDVIGLAGFDYDFKALSEPRNELAEAYRDMFAVGQTITPMSIFQEVVPGASYLPTKRTRVLNSSRKIAQKVGLELLAKKKRAVLAAHSNNLEKGTDIGKDLLSIVVKANMAIDLRDDQRLPDDEVLAQITTFMLAGNETSSTALTWILHLLAIHPGIQGRLREEVTAVSDDRPEMDVLNTLPLLDNVIRESLRLLGPVPLTVREAQKDTVIPLGKPLRGRDSTMLESVTITKGTNIVIPLMSVNTSTEIWGPDAREFNPDRYDSVDSEKLKHVPGIWGNLLSFLGGTRNCIGYRFALAEIKVILFILIRNLEFQRLKSQPEIEQKASIVMRPRVKGEEAAGLQMPLMVIPLSAYLSS